MDKKARSGIPTIVCLCGSTRFGEAFARAQLEETLAGKIVLTIGCNMRTDTAIFGHLSREEQAQIKARLDELHLRRIDLADEVLILNVGGYIGESTQRELTYALAHGKNIRFLEQQKAELTDDELPQSAPGAIERIVEAITPQPDKNLEAEIISLRNKVAALERERKGEVWYWVGDGHDHPESLCCPILIEPEDIMKIISSAAISGTVPLVARIMNEDGTSGVATGADEPQPDEGRLISSEEKARTFADYPYLDPSFEDDYRDEVAVLLETQLSKDQEHEQNLLKRVFEEIEASGALYPHRFITVGSIRQSEVHVPERCPRCTYEALKQKYLGKEAK